MLWRRRNQHLELGQPINGKERRMAKRYRDEDEAHDADVQRKDDQAAIAAIQAACQHIAMVGTSQCRKCGVEIPAAPGCRHGDTYEGICLDCGYDTLRDEPL